MVVGFAIGVFVFNCFHTDVLKNIYGIYASGGPLIVYPVSRIITNKSIFRSTLIAVWLFFNIILIVSYVATNRFTLQSLTCVAMLLPIIALSVFLGEWLHNYVNEYKFGILVYTILSIAGLFIAMQ
jgi:uncharacterized membrane protein YfcA